jgi:hypothetical protein
MLMTCLLGVGKFLNTMSDLMQRALYTVQIWCSKLGLSVNPDKTDIIVLMKRKLSGFSETHFFGVALHHSMSVKYLGVIMDSWLTWREQLSIKAMKAHDLLWACRRSSEWSPSEFPHQKLVCTRHVSHIPRPAHSSQFDNTNGIS